MWEFLKKVLDVLPPRDIMTFLVIGGLFYLVLDKQRIIRSLAHETKRTAESLGRITELLRVLTYGRIRDFKKGLGDEEN